MTHICPVQSGLYSPYGHPSAQSVCLGCDVTVWWSESLDCEPRNFLPHATLQKVRSAIRQKINQFHLEPENVRYTCIVFNLFNTFCNTLKAKIPQLHWNNAICIYIHYGTKEIKKIIYCPYNRTAGRTQRPTLGQGGQVVIYLMPFLDKKDIFFVIIHTPFSRLSFMFSFALKLKLKNIH